jgi:hypothetical protein
LKEWVMAGKLDSLIAPWPPTREDILSDIKQLSEKGLVQVDACRRLAVSGTPLEPSVTDTLADAKRAAAKAGVNSKGEGAFRSSGLLQKYCSQCHSGQNAVYPLPLDDLSRLRTYVTEQGTSILERIERRTMPPSGEPTPSEEERSLMVHDLSEGKGISN